MLIVCSQCCQCKKQFPIGRLKNCGRCKNALYCSVECQKAAWQTHKQSCVLSSSAADVGGAVTAADTAVEKKEEKKQVKKKPNPQDQASFFDAVIMGTLNKARLKTLITKNIDIDGFDENDCTASFICIQRNDLTSLQLLLDFGANINVKDKRGLSLLYYSCELGYEQGRVTLVCLSIYNGTFRNQKGNELFIS